MATLANGEANRSSLISLLNKGRKATKGKATCKATSKRLISLSSSCSSLTPSNNSPSYLGNQLGAISFQSSGRPGCSCLSLSLSHRACLQDRPELEDGARQDSDPPDRQLHEPAGDLLQTAERDLQEGKRARHPLRRGGRAGHLLQHRPSLRICQHQVITDSMELCMEAHMYISICLCLFRPSIYASFLFELQRYVC